MAKEYSYGIAPYMVMSGYFYILLNKTSSESHFNFFKGKIEQGENIRECAIREFKEETGVGVDIMDLETYYFQKSPRKDIGIFLVDWSKYKHLPFHFQEKEIWSAVWVALKDIETSKNQQEIIDKIELDFESRKQQLRDFCGVSNEPKV